MKKNNDISFGYFGKLSSYPDFVKFNAGKNEILSLDKWLQDGIYYSKQKLKNEWKNFYKNSLPQYFIYPFTGTEYFVAGIIFPSSDKSGREFPFIIFSYLKKNLFEKIPYYLSPIFINDMFNSFEIFYDEIDDQNLTTLNENFSEQSFEINYVAILNEYESYLSQTTQEIFWERTLGNFNDEKKYNIVGGISDPAIVNSTVGLRVDFFSDKKNQSFDLSFFLHMIKQLSTNFQPAVFWSYIGNSKTILHIFIDKLIPLNYLDINNNLGTSERVLDLTQNSNNKNYKKSKHFLENKKLTLKELLQANI